MPKAQRAYQPPTLICTTHTSQQNQVLATALMATKTQQPQSMNRYEVMVLQSCRLHGVMWMPPLSPISTCNLHPQLAGRGIFILNFLV